MEEFFNKIKFVGEQSRVKKLLETIKCDNDDLGSIDFKKIMPIPESLQIEPIVPYHVAIPAYLKAIHPDTGDFGAKKVKESTFDDILEKYNKSCRSYELQKDDIMNVNLDSKLQHKFIEIGRIYIYNLVRHGAVTPYDWCCNNWGTIQPKCFSRGKGKKIKDTIDFMTINNFPVEIFYQLSTMFPDVILQCAWTCAAPGFYTGKIDIQNEEIIASNMPEDDSLEAFEISAEVLGDNIEDYHLRYDEKRGIYVRTYPEQEEKQ